MGNAWLKVKAWTKFILFGLLVVYLVLFITNNSERKASLWYWYQSSDQPAPETSVLRLVFFSFIAGAITAILVRMIWRTMHQIGESKKRAGEEKKQAPQSSGTATPARPQARVTEEVASTPATPVDASRASTAPTTSAQSAPIDTPEP